jgi:hypothetical protein
MVSPRYDNRSWPTYRIWLPSVELTDEEFATFLQTFDGLFLRGERFGVVLDARLAPPLSAKRRELVGKHGKEAVARHPGLLVGFALVLRSPIQRAALTAIRWILRSEDRTRAFGTLLDAENWIASELVKAGADAVRLA